MNATSVDGGVLTFTPSETVESYIYEQFGCTAALAQGYNILSFDIKGPEAASVSLEIQTQPNCDPGTTEYNSTYFTIDGLSGTMETIQVPLNSWPDANLNAVIGFLWYGFSKGLTGTDSVWQLDNVQLLCSGTPAPPPPTDPGTYKELRRIKLVVTWLTRLVQFRPQLPQWRRRRRQLSR